MIRSNDLCFSLGVTILILFGFCFLIGCSGRDQTLSHERLNVAVSVEPHAFLLERIGGNRLRIEVLVPAGREPEHYQTTPDKVAALSKAKVLFRTGMPFEEMLIPKLKSNANNLKIVDLRNRITLRSLELHDHHSHANGNIHVHNDNIPIHNNNIPLHNESDPHIWFAPTILKTEVQTVLQTLSEIDPAGAAQYQKNAEQFLEEIEELRIDLVKRLAPFKAKTVFVFHPAYGYFCDEFGLRQRAVEFEGKSPKPQQLTALIKEIRHTEDIPVIFVQPEFNQAPTQAITETTGIKMIIHSPLERNVLQSMKRFAEEIILSKPNSF